MKRKFKFEKNTTTFNVLPTIVIWTTFEEVELSLFYYTIYFKYKGESHKNTGL